MKLAVVGCYFADCYSADSGAGADARGDGGGADEDFAAAFSDATPRISESHRLLRY